VFNVRYKPLKIELGKTISMMLTKSGQLYSWGSFDPNKEKRGSREDPKLIAFNDIHTVVDDMVIGVNHCCILTSESVYMMGKDDDSGKMGLKVAKGNLFKKEYYLESRNF
jgi:alpha-tubulin suppressor-like RCC1 family protein